MRTLWWMPLIVAALAGCANAPAYKGPMRYAAGVPCVASWAALTAQSLPRTGEDGKAPALAFGASTPCVRNRDGEARPAVLFSLADVRIPAEILVTISGKDPVTLAPLLRVLGPDFAELAQYPFERFAKRGRDYSLSLFLNSTQPRATGLLVSVDDAWLGKENLNVAGKSQTTVWSTGLVTGSYTYGYEEKTSSRFSDVGTFSLFLKSIGAAQ